MSTKCGQIITKKKRAGKIRGVCFVGVGGGGGVHSTFVEKKHTSVHHQNKLIPESFDH